MVLGDIKAVLTKYHIHTMISAVITKIMEFLFKKSIAVIMNPSIVLYSYSPNIYKFIGEIGDIT